MNNPVAEVLDTFFNGRPALANDKTIRIRLTRAQIEALQNGHSMIFRAGTTHIVIVPPRKKAHQ